MNEFGKGANYKIVNVITCYFTAIVLNVQLYGSDFPTFFFYEPPNKISNTIVTTFNAITGTLRNCTAVNIPTA